MPKYIGQSCTSCRVPFNENDEIVVCPECGSPYHKACYKAEGRCINTVLHESGKEWQPEPVEPLHVPESAAVDKVCPNCGFHNDPSASFCTECGTSLSAGAEADPRAFGQNYGGGFSGQGQYGPYGQQGGFPGGDLPPFINVQTVSPDTDIDGITVGEYAEYVRSNTFSYIPKFVRFAKYHKKLSFNFAAFFLSPFWFAYRKMPLFSAITALVSLISSIPYAMEAMTEIGIAQFSAINSRAFAVVSTVCYILSYAVSIFSGLFGDYIYYRHAKNDITAIKSEAAGDLSKKAAMYKAGGTSIGYVFALIAITYGAAAIITALLL